MTFTRHFYKTDFKWTGGCVYDNNVSVRHEECKFGAYGTKNGINGKIYSLLGYTNDVWEFNPFSGELKKCYSLNKTEKVHYAGGA